MAHECNEKDEFKDIWSEIGKVREKQSAHDIKLAVLETKCASTKEDIANNVKVPIKMLISDRKKIAVGIIGSIGTLFLSTLAYIWKNHG